MERLWRYLRRSSSRLLFIALFVALVGAIILRCSTGISLKLYAVKGSIENGTVTLYSLNESGERLAVLASEVTQSGEATLSVNAVDSPVEFEVSSGSFTDEATGKSVEMESFVLRTRLTSLSESRAVAISPLTEVAVQRSAALSGTLTENITSANEAVSSASGLTDITKLSENPTQAPSDASSETAKYGLLLAGICGYAKTLGTDVTSLVMAFAADFASDGSFNADKSTGSVALTSTAWSTGVSSAMETFLTDSRNPGFTSMSKPILSRSSASDNTSAATVIKAVARATSISVTASSSCYASSSGSVKCWGQNTHGQLGQGHTNHLGDGANEMGNNLTAISLGTGRTAIQISSGWHHNCALLDNGSVKCWGHNTYGQLGQGHTNHLGDGANEMGNNLTAISLGTGRTAKFISAGGYFTCALLDNDTIKCWGRNNRGQLGQGNTNNLGDEPNEMGDSLSAIELGQGRTAKQVAAGTYHACALLDDDTMKCWGFNFDGQLGQGTTDSLGDGANELGNSLSPINLGTGRKAKQISAGSCHTCALLDNDTTQCWGNNAAGQLGQGNTNSVGDSSNEMGDFLSPIDVGTGRIIKQILTGYDVNCALLDNATAKCWGTNADGELGQGHTNNLGDQTNELGDNLSAINLGTGRTVKQIAVGNWSSHGCALLDNDTIKCWGKNDYGQLGQGNTSNLGDQATEMGDSLSAVDVGS